MFNVTRPQSTLFLVIIAVMALLLLMLPALSEADPGQIAPREPVGKKLQLALDGGQKTPRALAEIKPLAADWYANAGRATRPTGAETAEADIFFDLDREVTIDTNLLKGSAGVQINW